MKKSKQLIILFFFLINCHFSFSQHSFNKQQIQEKLEELPVAFRKNLGQWNEEIIYQGGSPGWQANVNFLKNGLSFGFMRPYKSLTNSGRDEYEKLVWNLYFKNANSLVSFDVSGMEESHTNYLIGDPSKHRINVPDFRILNYKNIYSNIDINYYHLNKSLKYDFVVHPKGKPSDILMTAAGIDDLRINSLGDLEIKTSWGVLTEKIPESYQIINGQKIQVKVSYLIIDKNTYTFKINSEYNKVYDLIIDPVSLAWSTFYGGAVWTSNFSYITDIDVDANNNVYATGFYDGSFPTTPGSYQPTNAGPSDCDAFVLKLNPNATAAVYATYLGGNSRDQGYSLRVNTAGEAFACGYTTSSDFITPSALFACDAYLVRLNVAGTAAVYAKRFGGSSEDGATAVDVNSSNEAFVTGWTTSTDYPLANATYSTKKGATTSDMFVTRFDNSGAIVYSSYFGSSGVDGNKATTINDCAQLSGIVGTSTGIAYVASFVGDVDFPTTAGAYQTVSITGTVANAVAFKVNTNSGALMYSTFITYNTGISSLGTDIAVNAAGEMFVCGVMGGVAGGVVDNFSSLTGNNADAFIVKINPLGAGASDMIYNTTFGGTARDEAFGIGITDCGEAFVAGRTTSTDFPVTSCAFQSTNADGGLKYEQFLTKFDGSGTQEYGSYMGGSDWDYWGMQVAVRGNGKYVYIGGTSHSANFPTTSGVVRTTYTTAGADEPVVYKFKTDEVANFSNTAAVCNSPITFTDLSTGTCIWKSGTWTPSSWKWYFGDGTTSTLQNPTHTYLSGGTYSVKLVVNCPADSITKTITLPLGVLNLNPTSTAIICPTNGTASVSPTGGSGSYTYLWNPGGQTTSTISTNVPGVYTVYVSDGLSCGNSTAVTIALNPAALTLSSATVSPTSCLGSDGQASITASGGTAPYTYLWSSGPSGKTNSTLAAGLYTVTVTDATCYKSTTSILIPSPSTVLAFPVIMSNVCGASLGSVQAGIPSGGTPGYTNLWSTGSSNFFLSNLIAGTYTLTVTDAVGCTGVGTVSVGASVTVNPTSTPAGCGVGGGTASANAAGGTPGYTYSWSGGGQTTATATGLTPGTYTVQVNDASFCYVTKTIVVASGGGAAVTISTGSSPSNCGTATGTIFTSPSGGTGSYTFLWSGGATSQTVSGVLSGTFSVTVSDASGCSANSSVIVTQTPPSYTLSTSSTNASCVGANGTATATPSPAGAYTYTWSDSQSAQTAINLSAATYTVTVNDGSCSIVSTVVVTQAAISFSVSTISNPANCSGSGGSASVMPNPVGTYSYTWSDSQSGSTAINLSASAYTVTVTDGLGCFIISAVSVTQTGIGFSVSTSSTPASCSGSGGSVTATPSVNAVYTYLWSNSVTAATNLNIAPGNYTVTVTDALGCAVIETASVLSSSGISLTSSSVPDCPGVGGSVSVNTTGGTNPYTYIWSQGGATGSTLSGLSDGTYTVTVQDALTCQTITTVTLVNLSSPIASAGSDTIITSGSSITLSAGGGTSYLWSPGGSLSCTVCSSPVASPTSETSYTVIVTDVNGCTATDDVLVMIEIKCGGGGDVIFIPNAFSPNGDHQNDELKVYAGNCLKSFILEVFNRWGEKVFEAESVSAVWDGIFRGQKVDSGVFVYKVIAVTLSDETIEKKGNITLVR